MKQALSKPAYLWRLHKRLGRYPVLVYTVGKVGSTAIEVAIREGTDQSFVKLHRMTRQQIRLNDEFHRSFSVEPDPKRRATAGYVRRMIALGYLKRPVSVVCGVRDPLARFVSSFFQQGEHLGYFDPDQASTTVDVPALTDHFVDFFRRTPTRDWFSEELQRTTGIDVYTSRFPREIGYTTLENERFRVLIIRYEDLGRVAPDALGSFLGIDRALPLPDRNVGDEKRYALAYQTFRREACLPESLVREACDDRLARHFYTDREITAFRSHWRTTPDGPTSL